MMSVLVLKKIFRLFALFFNNQRKIPYLNSLWPCDILYVDNMHSVNAQRNLLDTLRQAKFTVASLWSRNYKVRIQTTAHNLPNYFSTGSDLFSTFGFPVRAESSWKFPYFDIHMMHFFKQGCEKIMSVVLSRSILEKQTESSFYGHCLAPFDYNKEC